MNILTGNFIGKLDEKGRIVLPSIFRKELSNNNLKIRKDISKRVLILSTVKVWTEDLDNIKIYLNEYNDKFLINSRDIKLDVRGRILIPKEFLDYAEINEKLSFRGKERVIELWRNEEE